VEKATGKKVEVIYTSPRPGDVRRNYSDISKAKKILGYQPFCNLDRGLRETFNYFLSKLFSN